jgi:hypothetical protein
MTSAFSRNHSTVAKSDYLRKFSAKSCGVAFPRSNNLLIWLAFAPSSRGLKRSRRNNRHGQDHTQSQQGKPRAASRQFQSPQSQAAQDGRMIQVVAIRLPIQPVG